MAARDDAGARKAQHDKEVRDLQTQLSFLEEEISVLRRKLAESPRQVRVLEERLHETQANLAAVTGQNERLVATLKEAREQIIALNSLNPQVAARMARAFDRWKRFDEARQAKARAALERIRSTAGLSSDVLEIVDKALA